MRLEWQEGEPFYKIFCSSFLQVNLEQPLFSINGCHLVDVTPGILQHPLPLHVACNLLNVPRRWILSVISRVSLFGLGPSHSSSVFLFLLRAWNSSQFLLYWLHLATTFASSACLPSLRQVWSLILQRDGKRMAGDEQRYRIHPLAYSFIEAKEENEDLCKTIVREGEIKPRWYCSDGCSCETEKIFIDLHNERENISEIYSKNIYKYFWTYKKYVKWKKILHE